MMRIWPAVALVCVASAAPAQCRLEGRNTFAAGLQALARGDLPNAGAQFSALVHVQPDCAEARNNLAAVRAEQGRFAEAAEQLRRAVQLRPDYERAHSNLRRVEALAAKAPAPSPTTAQPTPTTAEATPPAAQSTPTPEASATATETAVGTAQGSAPVAGAPAPEPATASESKPVPPGIAALEPQGATACAIDTARQQVCVYTRAVEAIVPGRCYAAKFRVGSWPQWVVTGDGGTQPIRLVDENGRLRLRIAPERTAVTGDVVWLRQADFDSLAATLAPGRTGFVVVEGPDRVANPTQIAAIQEALQRWRSVWEHKQFAEYVTLYSQSFVPPPPLDLDHWRAHKRHLFEQPGRISVEIGAPSVFVVDDGTTAITVFERWYRSKNTVAHDLKALRWQLEGDGWKIRADAVLRPNLPHQMATR